MQILIDSVDKTESVLRKSLNVRNRINDRADECRFTIKKKTTTPYRPDLNDEVIITNDGVRIFAGVIITIEEVVSAGSLIEYSIVCTDYAHFLQRRLVTERYEDTTASAIINSLISTYTSDGFTTNGVTVSKEITSFSFNGLTISKALEKLAKSLNALWYVDYNKDIHFFYRNSEPAPFQLTDTSGNYIYNSLVIKEDITKLRNSITVRGGTNPSTVSREKVIISQSNEQDIWPVGYKFSNKPVVLVNDVAQVVGVEFLDDDSLFDCMWSYTEKYIRFTTGNIPAVDDEIKTQGKIEIPVIVRTPNNGSIEEYGVFEYQINDETIATNDEAIERAVAELQAYANELHEGQFETYNNGLRSGQILDIVSTERDKAIRVVLQDVRLSSTDPEGNVLRYKVRFATLKTIGVIEFLQNSLMNEEIIEDASETLLNYIQQPEDVVSFSDDGVQEITIRSAPYKWSNDAGTTPNRFIWNFSTWS